MSDITASFDIYWDDLMPKCQKRIYKALKIILKEDIDEEIAFGLSNKKSVEFEVIDDYINRHNGWTIVFED